MTITLRQESDARATTKGDSLTFGELDQNFIDLLNRSSIVVKDDSNNQFTIGNDGTAIHELSIVGDATISTSLTQDSTGATQLQITSAGGGGGGVIDIVAGSNIEVDNTQDSTGAYTVSLAGQVSSAVLNQPTFKGFQETKQIVPGDSSGLNIDVQDGNICEIQLDNGQAVTFSGFTNAVDGQSATLIVKHDLAGAGSMTFSADSTNQMLFANGDNSISNTAGAVDIVGILYIGGIYYISINKNFAGV